MSHQPSLATLVEDLFGVLDQGVAFTPDPSRLSAFTKGMEAHMHSSLAARTSSRELGKMWFSDLGEPCKRKMWYKWNAKDEGEVLQGHTLFKFLYGNILEEQVLYLAKEAGHKVEREQERVEYLHEPTGWWVTGRIDAYIDGVLVDVKSTSTYGYKKYKEEGVTRTNDTFGYRYQIAGYNLLDDKNLDGVRGHEPGTERERIRPKLLFVDKQNGHINITTPEGVTKEELDNDIQASVEAITQDTPLSIERAYKDQPVGKSGNYGLGIACSYCPFKGKCWPGLKAYAYSNKPVFLTHVAIEPRVPEIEL